MRHQVSKFWYPPPSLAHVCSLSPSHVCCASRGRGADPSDASWVACVAPGGGSGGGAWAGACAGACCACSGAYRIGDVDALGRGGGGRDACSDGCGPASGCGVTPSILPRFVRHALSPQSHQHAGQTCMAHAPTDLQPVCERYDHHLWRHDHTTDGTAPGEHSCSDGLWQTEGGGDHNRHGLAGECRILGDRTAMCTQRSSSRPPPTTLCFPRSQTAAQLSTIWSSTRPQ